MNRQTDRNCTGEIEELAGELDSCIQILWYVYQEVVDVKLPENREPTLDDIYARVPTVCFKVLEDMKSIREELYKLSGVM